MWLPRYLLAVAMAAAFLACLPAPATEGNQPLPFAVAASVEEFCGRPLFVPIHELWRKRGGWGGILTAADGTVIAFRSPGGGEIRRSHDGGVTWEPPQPIDQTGDPATANGGNALVDETTGALLYVNPEKGWLYRSHDSGSTWNREAIEVRADHAGLQPGIEGAGAMQCGITLAFGAHKGRLLSPARIMGPKNSNDVRWRPYHFSTAIYSDDHGRTWQTSHPFPVLGTGEAAIAERSDGTLLYNSREHMSRGNRFLATSYDGGSLWAEPRRSTELPDGPRGSSYGLMGGMVRLPVADHDILLFSNVDTNAGAMPSQTGGSIAGGREKITVWASFDGGHSWPVKRRVYEGPSAYSCLGVGRSGTPSEGHIYLIFEGGPDGSHAAVNVATFNLTWLLDGQPLPTP